MNLQNSSLATTKKAFKESWLALKNNRVIFIPFLIFAIVDLVSLFILFLAPRMPLRLALGPIIRTIWSETFLHYPANFILLQKLSFLSRLALSVLIGSLLTGMAVSIIQSIFYKRPVELKKSFLSALKIYFSLFLVTLIVTGLFYFTGKAMSFVLAKYFSRHARLLFIGARIWFGPVSMALNFLIALFIQALFIYAIPLLIIEKMKFKKAIARSFVLLKKLFIPTILLIGLPMLLYIPIIVMEYNTVFLIEKFIPEIILVILMTGIIINSLLIDPLITAATTLLYLKKKEEGQL